MAPGRPLGYPGRPTGKFSKKIYLSQIRRPCFAGCTACVVFLSCSFFLKCIFTLETLGGPGPFEDFPRFPLNHNGLDFSMFFGLPQTSTHDAQNVPKMLSKSSQNPIPNPSKRTTNRHLILQTPKIKNNATLPRFCSFLTFPGPRKSSQNRCQNAFKISFILDTLLEP